MNIELKDIQEQLFIKMESIDKKIDCANSEIREMVSLFEDPQESDDDVVKKNLKLKSDYIDEYHIILNKIKEVTNDLYKDKKPTCIKTRYFIENFRRTQDALDYINNRLEVFSIMEGTKDLFTGLGYNSCVSSYCPERLCYVEYKMPEIFGLSVELGFE